MISVTVLIKNPALKKNEFNCSLSLISPSKQERIKQFHSERDAQNCLFGDLLVRYEICRLIGLRNNQLEFSTNTHGKPFLINQPNIHFNISHSGHYIACAIDDKPIGIDIELIKKADVKIANRYFTSDEVTYIMEKHQDYRFFEVWTKKESYIKWEGVGLSKQLSSFSVLDASEKSKVYYQMVYYDGKAICHVCSPKNEKPTTKVINSTEFIHKCLSQLKQ